ncbi:MAG: hypothetical protein ABIG45_04455, partial [Bacillota bacterium]
LLNKEEIELQVLPDFQALIDTYDMGVKINDVRIQNISVPKEVSAAYEDVNNAKNEKTKRLDEAERYQNEILPKARSTAYETIKQAEAYKAEVIANANADTAVFSAVLAEYQIAPEVTRKRLLIETLEAILAGSSRIIVSDNTSDVIKILDLDETGADMATSVSAVEGGGN